MTGIPSECRQCALPLDARNITGVCAECTLLGRNIRLGHPPEPEVALPEARTNFMAVFGGLHRKRDHSAFYGETCRCGRFRARKDTRRCEWCSGPRRFPPKRTKRRRSVNGNASIKEAK